MRFQKFLFLSVIDEIPEIVVSKCYEIPEIFDILISMNFTTN